MSFWDDLSILTIKTAALSTSVVLGVALPNIVYTISVKTEAVCLIASVNQVGDITSNARGRRDTLVQRSVFTLGRDE
jgi:hypothetical protein